MLPTVISLNCVQGLYKDQISNFIKSNINSYDIWLLQECPQFIENIFIDHGWVWVRDKYKSNGVAIAFNPSTKSLLISEPISLSLNLSNRYTNGVVLQTISLNNTNYLVGSIHNYSYTRPLKRLKQSRKIYKIAVSEAQRHGAKIILGGDRNTMLPGEKILTKRLAKRVGLFEAIPNKPTHILKNLDKGSILNKLAQVVGVITNLTFVIDFFTSSFEQCNCSVVKTDKPISDHRPVVLQSNDFSTS